MKKDYIWAFLFFITVCLTAIIVHIIDTVDVWKTQKQTFIEHCLDKGYSPSECNEIYL